MEIPRRFALALACSAAVSLTGCASETLFRSNFDDTPSGQPPATIQAVGTAQVAGPPGSVTVVDPPVLPSGKWVQISRPTGPDVAGLQGKFSEFRGDGRYTFSATMFMPSGSGIATIQFEAFGNPPANPQGFLHLDFMESNSVRIDDDDDAVFGSFPRDQPFVVQVTLDIGATQSTAHIVLDGADASGEHDHTIAAPFQNIARQFGAVRVWQGFPHTGAFQATNIVVTRKKD